MSSENGIVVFPADWPPYHNGIREPCDMLDGPCACGAWHKLYEWDFEKKTRKPLDERLEAHRQDLRDKGLHN